MEVHAHTHTERKKFTHYLWEFIMLFLAVFCGFVAENVREHYVERQKEKEYMQSLAEDLRGDTISIQKYIRLAKASQLKIDTMVLYVKYHNFTQTVDYSLVELNTDALPWFNFTRINRTESQLKNAGNMRLIHNKNVANDLVEYWAAGEQTINAQLRYETYRSDARRTFFELLKTYDFYLYSRGLIERPGTVPLMKNDPALQGEYGNYMGVCGIVLQALCETLQKQLQKAKELLASLQKGYEIK